MNGTLIQDLETKLGNGTIKLIDFMIELAVSVFDGISDSTMHEYLIGEGYFADSTELLEYYDNN